MRIACAAVMAASLLAFGGFAGVARAGGRLELLTTGPTAGHPAYSSTNAMVSSDARHVFFETREKLVSADQDGNCLDLNADDPETAPRIDCQDVYERFNGRTRLVSSGGNGPYDARLLAISSDGSKAFFATAESLVPQDTNQNDDIYEWSNGMVKLVTKGTHKGTYFIGASKDGSKVFFATNERLTAEDRNNCGDIYMYSHGRITMVSTGPNDAITPPDLYPCDSFPIDTFHKDRAISSPDGAHFYFYSYRPLVSADRDEPDQDLYERSGNKTILVSTGPTSGTGGSDPISTDFITASPDGSRVFFRTNDPLVPEDQNSGHGIFSYDVYERDSSGVHLFAPPQVRSNPSLSAEPLDTSYDGSRVFLWTNARLSPDDTNSDFDIYERIGNSYNLVTTGPLGNAGPGSIFLNLFNYAFSRDGTRVFFETNKRLVPEDTNNNFDIYMREGGVTRLVTAGTPGYVGFFSIKPDGKHLYITTTDRLLPEDTNSVADVYVWDGRSLKLLDIGVPNTDGLGWIASSNDERHLVLATKQALTPDDTDNLFDLYGFDLNRPPDCSGPAESPGGRGPLCAPEADSFTP